jgi:hypothetical protein
MKTLRSEITGHDFAGEEFTDGAGHRFKLDPNNRHHRAVAQAAEAAEVREKFPHLAEMLRYPQWVIPIN